MNIMNQIEYPIIYLGDELPAKECSLVLVETAEELGMCNWLALIKGAYEQNERYYSSNGSVYKIKNVSPHPSFNWLKKLLAYTIYNPTMHVNVEFERLGGYKITSVKKRIIELIDHDPGGLMLQFVDYNEWENALKTIETPTQLFDFIINKAFADNDLIEEKS